MYKHKDLLEELQGYARSADGVQALMQHIARRVHEEMTRYNWVGFFLADASLSRTLVLGPYVGSFAPLERIPFDAGLCGLAASSQKTVVVNDVADDLRYVSRAEMVRSELVVPVLAKNELVAVIDVESYFAGTFSKQDQEFVESCAAVVGGFIESHATAGVKK